MKKLASKKTKNNFEALLDEAQENAYWVMKANMAAEKGFIGKKKSEKFIEDLLNV